MSLLSYSSVTYLELSIELGYACMKGDHAVVKSYLGSKYYKETFPFEKLNFYKLAYKNGHFDIADYFVNEYNMVVYFFWDGNILAEEFKINFAYACIKGDYNKVKSYLVNGYKSIFNEIKVFILACKHNHINIAKLFIESENFEQLFAYDEIISEDTVLTTACNQKNYDMVKFLLDKRPQDMNSDSDITPPLINACLKNDIELLKIFQEKFGNDIFNSRRSLGKPNTVQYACQYDCEKSLNFLLKIRTINYYSSISNDRPIVIACQKKKLNIVKKLSLFPKIFFPLINCNVSDGGQEIDNFLDKMHNNPVQTKHEIIMKFGHEMELYKDYLCLMVLISDNYLKAKAIANNSKVVRFCSIVKKLSSNIQLHWKLSHIMSGSHKYVIGDVPEIGKWIDD